MEDLIWLDEELDVEEREPPPEMATEVNLFFYLGDYEKIVKAETSLQEYVFVLCPTKMGEHVYDNAWIFSQIVKEKDIVFSCELAIHNSWREVKFAERVTISLVDYILPAGKEHLEDAVQMYLKIVFQTM